MPCSSPPSMFDRTHVARRIVFAAVHSKSIWGGFRCLYRIIASLGVISLWLFCILYVVVEYAFTNFYLLLLGPVWKPAFPLSWRLVLMTLFVVPAIALVRVLWLSVYLAIRAYRLRCSKSNLRPSSSRGYTVLPWSEANSPGEGWGDDEDHRLEGDADISRLHIFEQQPSLATRCWWLCVWFALLCVSLWVAIDFEHPGDSRYLPLIEHANAHPRREGYNNNEKIFIAALFSNNKGVIPHWSNSLIQAIHYLGEDNVFVSILESGSQDGSPTLLRQLDDRLEAMKVSRRIWTDGKTVSKPEGMSNQERIHYLSALRNLALGPLLEMGGYDKVIFSNDILIEPESIIELLKTADGGYDMACAMDFSHFGLYDAWVLRDKRGRLVSGIWPYFFDGEAYEAMKNEAEVPVFTCWNGIVVFTADPVLPIHLRSNRTLSTDPLPFVLPATHPAAHDPSMRGPTPALTPPVGFRASAPEECYSSESFLLSYDFRRVFNLQRIYVNPRVIVAYSWRIYVYFKWFLRHPVLKWWIEKVYDGAWMHKSVTIVGDEKRVSQWDGGDCHPWW